jgi:glycosyltransferase involved in cell wall biosynthesis
VSDPGVSVVIPTRNGERYLAEAIDSVLAQTRPPAEVVVVDDGSSDGTRAIAEGYGGVVRCISQDRAGPGAARNRGVAESRGEYLAFLDHDDLWPRDKLELQLGAFAADPGVQLVFGHMQHFLSPELEPEAAARIVCLPEPRPATLASAMLIRRGTMKQLGSFGTVRFANEFLEPLLRSEELGLRRLMLPETVLLRRLHETNFHIVNPTARRDYAFALKASLDRRRAEGQA